MAVVTYSSAPYPATPRTPWARRLIAPAAIIVAMWVVYIVQVIVGPAGWRHLGLPAGQWDHLWAVVTSPFLHGGILHLINNTIAFLWLGMLTAVEGPRRFWLVTAISALTAGIGVIALSAPGSVTIGMSGVIFGYFGYLLVAAFVEQNRRQKVARIAAVTVIFLWWGTSFFAGFFPRGTMSWQAHLFGAIGGAIVAVVAERKEARGA